MIVDTASCAVPDDCKDRLCDQDSTLARAKEVAEVLSYKVPYLSWCCKYTVYTARTCLFLVHHILVDELVGAQSQLVDGGGSPQGWSRCRCGSVRVDWAGTEI